MILYNVLLDFIRSHLDWQDILAMPPYDLRIKQCPFADEKGNLLYPELYMLSYNQLSSDFHNPIVRACRGCIISVENPKQPSMVCTPFYKFGNYGESYCDDIDWESANVLEKVDGCLIKYFVYKDTPFWVTNNGWNIDVEFANTMPVPTSTSATPKTYQDLITIALQQKFGKEVDIYTIFKDLPEGYTYMFELISPYNRVICDYSNTDLIFLGMRNINTYEENSPYKEISNILQAFKTPIQYDMKGLTPQQIKEVVDQIEDNQHEGVVVCDKAFHRIKIKSKHYMFLKYLKGEVGFTPNRLLSFYKEGQCDDLLVGFPELETNLNVVINTYNQVVKILTELQQIGADKYTLLLTMVDKREAKKQYAAWVLNEYENYSKYLFDITKEKPFGIEKLISNLNWEDLVNILEKN